MDDELWYFQVGGCLGFLPALAAFVGGWWYCAETYGFLFGFGLGWLPALILAALVFLAVMLLWGPALAATVYFVVLPALRDHPPAEASATVAASSVSNEPVSPSHEYEQEWDDPYAGFSRRVAEGQSDAEINRAVDHVIADAAGAIDALEDTEAPTAER